MLDKVFDPFFTTKGVGQGTGQGLAISHDVITRKHHGSIKVESVEGEGTTFTLLLPLTPEGTEKQ
jgi:signal transduction histidine kinase